MTDPYAHPDWPALVAAVRADPASDLPRLIAADWLDDRGEHERAEFVRRMVADAAARIASVPGDRPPVWLTYEQSAPGVARWELDRGFVSAVVCSAAWWVALGDKLLAREPVASVTLTTWPRMTRRAWSGGVEFDHDPERSLVPERVALLAGDVTGRMLMCLSYRWPGVTFTLPPDQPNGWRMPARSSASGDVTAMRARLMEEVTLLPPDHPGAFHITPR